MELYRCVCPAIFRLLISVSESCYQAQTIDEHTDCSYPINAQNGAQVKRLARNTHTHSVVFGQPTTDQSLAVYVYPAG